MPDDGYFSPDENPFPAGTWLSAHYPRGLPVPAGYRAVEHDDGVVHAIDLDDLPETRPVWRAPVVCGRATGVSSDEGGHEALNRSAITCWECAAILAEPAADHHQDPGPGPELA